MQCAHKSKPQTVRRTSRILIRNFYIRIIFLLRGWMTLSQLRKSAKEVPETDAGRTQPSFLVRETHRHPCEAQEMAPAEPKAPPAAGGELGSELPHLQESTLLGTRGQRSAHRPVAFCMHLQHGPRRKPLQSLRNPGNSGWLRLVTTETDCSKQGMLRYTDPTSTLIPLAFLSEVGANVKSASRV